MLSDGTGDLEKTQTVDATIEDQEWTFFQTVGWMIKETLFLSGSFSFSLGMVFLTALMGYLKMANALQVAPLALTLFESLVASLSAVYYGMSIDLSPEFGDIRNEDDDGAQAQVLQRMASRYQAGLILSVPLSVAAIMPMIYSQSLLEALGQNPLNAAAAQSFTRILSISVWPTIHRMITEQFILASGRNKPAMIIAGINLILGTSLAAFLGFGPPAMGLKGIAWGFVAESWLTTLGFSIFARLNGELGRIPYLSGFNFKEQMKQMGRILKQGYAFSLEYGFEFSVGFALSIFAGWLGNNALASQNFAQSLIFITKIPFIAAGIVAMQRYGILYQRDLPLAVRNAYGAVIASAAIAAPVCIIAMAYPQGIIRIFSSTASPDVEELAAKLLRIVGAGTLMSSANVVFMFVPKHAGDNVIPHVITISSLWAGVGVGYCLAKYLDWGVVGLGVGLAAGQTGGSIVNGIRFFKTVNGNAVPGVGSQGYTTIQDIPETPEGGSCAFFRSLLPKKCLPCGHRDGESALLLDGPAQS